MTITPDTKNWTWVLDRRCPECGFDSSAFPREEVGRLLRDNIGEWQTILAGDGDQVRGRRLPDVWSPLEYACHVRDVFRLYDERLALMMAEEAPDFANWDQDATAIEERYELADPAVVQAGLTAAGRALADRFETVGRDQWARTGKRSDGVAFTIETFARYFLHDPVHHIHDVRAPR